MKLATITIAFPLFRLKSRVVHFTPRRAITFEQAILGLVRRFGRNPRWSGSSVLEVFQNVLLVSDAEKLVLPSLSELVDHKVLAHSGDRAALARAHIADLSITEKGLSMLEQGMLPATEVENRVAHLYDPVKNVLVKEGRASLYLKGPLPASVGQDLVPNTYPRPLIQERVHQEGHDWLNPNSEILDVRLDAKEVLWKAATVELIASPQGELHLSAEDLNYAELLRRLDPDVTLNHLIVPGLNGSVRPNGTYELVPERDFSLTATTGADFFSLNELADRMSFADRSVHFVSYDLQAQSQGIVAAIKRLKSGLVVVHGTPESHEGPWFQWGSRGVAIVHIHDPYPLPGCLCFGSDGRNWFAGSFSFSVGHLNCRIPWGYALKKEEVLPDAKACLDRLEDRIIASGQLEAIAMMVFWKPVEQVWNIGWSLVSSVGFEPAQALKKVLGFRGFITRASGVDKLPPWPRDAVSFLCSAVEENKDVPLAILADQIVEALTHCGPLTREQADLLRNACKPTFDVTGVDHNGPIQAKLFAAIAKASRGHQTPKPADTASVPMQPSARNKRQAKAQESPHNPPDRPHRISDLPSTYR